MFFLQFRQVLNDFGVIYCGAVGVDSDPRLTHLKVGRLLVTSKHILSCPIEDLAVILLDQVVPHYCIIDNFFRGDFLRVPIRTDPELLKHNFCTWTLWRAEMSLFQFCIGII